MLEASENEIIETIVREQGLSEDNCLIGLTGQQLKVWTKYALLHYTIPEIIAEMFSHRRNISESTIRYILADAQLRIIANLLKDADIELELQHRHRTRKRIGLLIEKVEEKKRIKGAKVRCRLQKPS